MVKLTTEQVDGIRCEPLATPDAPRELCRVVGAEDDALRGLLAFQGWSRLRYYAECLRDGLGGSFDDIGFVYDSDERWPGDEPFSGVTVYVPWAESVLERDAFERLMARFLGAVVATIRNAEDAVTHTPWWPEFVAAVDVLQERVDAQGRRP